MSPRRYSLRLFRHSRHPLAALTGRRGPRHDSRLAIAACTRAWGPRRRVARWESPRRKEPPPAERGRRPPSPASTGEGPDALTSVGPTGGGGGAGGGKRAGCQDLRGTPECPKRDASAAGSPVVVLRGENGRYYSTSLLLPHLRDRKREATASGVRVGVGIRRFPSMPKSACCARVHPIVLSATRPCATRAPRKLPRCLATPGGKDDSLRTCRWGARNRAPRAAQGPAAPSLPGSGAEWSRAPVRPRFHPAGAASGPSARARTTRPLAATTPNSGRGARRASTWVS